MPATILGLPPSHLPLLLHLLIETPASLSFLLRPESQLPLLSSTSSPSPSPSPTTKGSSSSAGLFSRSSRTSSSPITAKEATEARLVLRNFGGLLLSVNCLVIYLLFRLNTGTGPGNGNEEVIRGVTGCLSLYHVFPQYRAWRRIYMNMFPSSADEKVKDEEDETQKTLGGPMVHFIVHMIVGGLMSAVGFGLL